MENNDINFNNNETNDMASDTRPVSAILLPPADNPDFVLVPREGEIVRKGYYKGRGFGAGHRLPYPTDYADAYALLSRKLLRPNDAKGKLNFEKYFEVISFADYNDPQYYNGFAHKIGEVLPEEKVAPLASMLGSGEFYNRFVRVESGWYALTISNRLNPGVESRVIYLSDGGYAINSSDIESLRKGRVPELCYLIDVKHNPTGFIKLDVSYFDGTHEDFLNTYYQMALTELSDMESVLLKYCPDFAFKAKYDRKDVEKAYENGRAQAQKKFE